MIDLISMKAILWHDETMGAEYSVEEIPADLLKKAEAFRAAGRIRRRVRRRNPAQVSRGRETDRGRTAASLRKATIGMKLFPVACGTSFKNKGVQTLLDAVVDYLPSAARRSSDRGHNPRTWRRQSPQGRRQGAVLRAGVQDHD